MYLIQVSKQKTTNKKKQSKNKTNNNYGIMVIYIY